MPTRPFVEKIQSLAQGISQQARSLRYKGQCEDATNVDFSVVDGARKRPGGFSVINVPDADENTTYRMHRIERDDQEEYAVIYGRDFLEVVDLTNGVQATIDKTDTVALDYISAQSAKADDLRLITIADTTFICNTKRSTRTSPGSEGADIDSSRMPVKLVRTALEPLTFKLSSTSWGGRKYYQQILQQTAGATTSGTFKLTYLGYTTTHTLNHDANSDDVQKALEGNGITTGDTAIFGIQPFPYGKVICTGGPLPDKPIYINLSDDFEVEELISVNSGTLNGGNYGIKRGNEDRDPAPEFIRSQQPIRDIGYFRNRLCLAAYEFMVFSLSDDLFNFFLETPLTITDADPIELQLSATDVNIVDFLVPFRNTVISLTQSGQQFELTSGDTFTSTTAAVTPTTRYSTQKVRPVLNGTNLFMAGESNGYSTLLEYYYDDASVSNTAVNVAAHVDTLLPPNMVKIVTTNTTDAVYCLPTLEGDVSGGATITSAGNSTTGDWNSASSWQGTVTPQPNDTAIIQSGDTISFTGYASNNQFSNWEQNSGLVSRIYAYRWYNSGNERKQSAWARWDFKGDAIQDAICIDDDLFLMRRQKSLADSKVYLKIDKLQLAQTASATAPVNRKVHLDHAITNVTGVHDDGDPGITTWTLSNDQSDSSYDTIVLADGTELTGLTVSTNPPKITKAGEYEGACIIGRKVTSELTLSETFPRTPQGEPMEDGRLTLKKVVVGHRRSGPYAVVVDSSLPDIVPTRTTNKSATTVDNGELNVPSAGQARDLAITLKSDNSYPVTWSSIEYHGEYNTITE